MQDCIKIIRSFFAAEGRGWSVQKESRGREREVVPGQNKKRLRGQSDGVTDSFNSVLIKPDLLRQAPLPTFILTLNRPQRFRPLRRDPDILLRALKRYSCRRMSDLALIALHQLKPPSPRNGYTFRVKISRQINFVQKFQPTQTLFLILLNSF